TMDPAADNQFPDPNGRIVIRGGINSTYYSNNMIQRHVVVRLKAGEQPSKALKELTGNLTAQMLSAPEALITIGDVLKASGKEAKGPNGGKVEVINVTKQDNGDVRVQIRVEQVRDLNGAVRITSSGNGNTQQGVASVVDARGKAFQIVGHTNQG